MNNRKYVLRALTCKEGWNRWGSIFGPSYFNVAEDRQIRQALDLVWKEFRGDHVSRDLLKNILDQLDPPYKGDLDRIYNLSLEDSEAVARRALFSWKGEQIILDASQELMSGEPDFLAISSKFEELGHAATSKKDVREYDPRRNIRELIRRESDCARYPTGLSRIDEQLDGGLWVKELGVIMAPPFKGKTHAMVHLGAYNLLQGTPVLHMTFEISAERTSMRYYQALLNQPRYFVEHSPQEVEDQIKELNLPDWKIHDYSSGGLGMGEFRRSVLKTTDEFGVPPLVIVDYLDLLSGTQYEGGKRFELADITERMRRVANEAECAIWTGSQVNRSGYDADIIRMEHVAESSSKVEKADVILTLNQQEAEKEQSVMRWHIAKARERQVIEETIPVNVVTAHQRFEDRIGW